MKDIKHGPPMKHTPGPWTMKKAASQTEIWADRGPVAELSLNFASSRTAEDS
jgi:hypothetical protein